jgi:hypothetical protein
LKDRAERNIFAARARTGTQKIFQEETPMRHAFSIPDVPVSLGGLSLAPKRADLREVLRQVLHEVLRQVLHRCLLLLRRVLDVMAAGGPMS